MVAVGEGEGGGGIDKDAMRAIIHRRGVNYVIDVAAAAEAAE